MTATRRGPRCVPAGLFGGFVALEDGEQCLRRLRRGENWQQRSVAAERCKRERDENAAKASASIFGGGAAKRAGADEPPAAHADIKRSAEDFVRGKAPGHAELHGIVFAMVERALPSAPARKLAFAPPASFE